MKFYFHRPSFLSSIFPILTYTVTAIVPFGAHVHALGEALELVEPPNLNLSRSNAMKLNLCFGNKNDSLSIVKNKNNVTFDLYNFQLQSNHTHTKEELSRFDFHIISQLNCTFGNNTVKVRRGAVRTVYLEQNGHLVNTSSPNRHFDPANFCIASLTDEVLKVTACRLSIQEEETEAYNLILFLLYCVVSFFLFLIVFLYGITWRQQKTHGWCILAFSTSNFLSYFLWTVSLGVWQFEPVDPSTGLRKHMIGTPFCVSNIAIVHYVDIAAFTWMTILNFDICYTIRSMTLRWNRTEGKLRFLLYSIFGFGIPAIVVMISLIREYEFGHFAGRDIRRQYGYDPCGLDKYYATAQVRILYGAAVICKLVFIFLLVKSLIDYHRGNRKVKVRVEQSSEQKIRSQALLYGKLFVLMDFTWVFEIVWGFNFGVSNTVTWYRTVQDVIYLLQALFLFWVFVCKDEMKDILIGKYKIFEGCFGGKTEVTLPLGNSSDYFSGNFGGAGAARTREKKVGGTSSGTSQSSALSNSPNS